MLGPQDVALFYALIINKKGGDMVEKREGGRNVLGYEFTLSHADIVTMMNDADVLLDGGNVPADQTFRLAIRKENDAEIVLSLRDMKPTDKLVFRFNVVVDSQANTEYTVVNVS